jgi:hypothetical protein
MPSQLENPLAHLGEVGVGMIKASKIMPKQGFTQTYLSVERKRSPSNQANDTIFVRACNKLCLSSVLREAKSRIVRPTNMTFTCKLGFGICWFVPCGVEISDDFNICLNILSVDEFLTQLVSSAIT